jgi:hypothetical protein
MAFSAVDWIMFGGANTDGIIDLDWRDVTVSNLVDRLYPVYETYEVLFREIGTAVAGGDPEIAAVHEALDDLLTAFGAGWAAWWSSPIADHALQLAVNGPAPQYGAAVGWTIAEKLLPPWALDSLRSWFNQKPAKEKDGSQPATTRPSANEPHAWTNAGHSPRETEVPGFWRCDVCYMYISDHEGRVLPGPCPAKPCAICGLPSLQDAINRGILH